MENIKEESIASKINFKVWGKVFKYIARHIWIFIVLLIAMFASSLLYNSIKPLLNQSAINALDQGLILSWTNSKLTFHFAFISFDMNMTGYLLISIAIVVVNAVITGLIMFLAHLLNMKVMLDMRRDSFRKIQELSFSYFDKTPSGWIIARVQSDTAKVSDTFAWGLVQIFWSLFDIVITLATMFTVDWRLSLIILAFVPIICVIGPIFEIKILKLSRQVRAVSSNYVSWISECINGNKTIKALSLQGHTADEAHSIADEIRIRSKRMNRTQALFRPAINFISTMTTAMIILISSILLKQQNVAFALASFVLFFGFIGQIYNPLLDTADIISDILGAQASVEKIMSLLETKPEVVDSKEVVEKYGDIFDNKVENFTPIKGKIQFDHVSFSYIPGVEVIHDMCLDIEPGTSIAIVGETGSGKSTTVNLLCRFYEPSRGRVLIDGVDYKERSVGFLRSKIGYVQQTPFIFNGTIRDNITYGKLDATDEEIIHASKAVDLHDFVMCLPNGYDTKLEDGGNELSTGQKQLISFARAIVRDPAIMILDEATANIDTETETIIQKSINNILIGRTSIIIAHRLSTIVDCDRILVMKDGLIVEDGSHKELMSNHDGYYRQLYMNQFKDFSIDEQLDKADTIE